MNQIKWRGENWKGFDIEDVITEKKRLLFTYTHYIYNITCVCMCLEIWEKLT